MNTSQPDSIYIQPAIVNVDVQSSPYTLVAMYNPPTYSNQKGKWYCDPEYINEIYQSDEFFTFIGIKAGQSRIQYIANDLPDEPAYCDVTINSVDLQSISLSPTTETIPFDGTFSIDISYYPNSAPHIGTWEFDDKVLMKLNTSTPDRADFKSITPRDEGFSTNLIYSSPDSTSLIKAQNTCLLTIKPADSVMVFPNTINCKAGSDFYIDIQYTPLDADKIGVWDYNSKYFSLESDSTSTRAHFKALYSCSGSDSILTYSVSENINDKVFCTVDYADLISISFDKSSESVKAGEEFYLDVIYTPDNALHAGNWFISATDCVSKQSDSTVDRGHFKALKESPLPVQIKFINGSKQATNLCTVDYTELQSVSVSPKNVEAKIGDTFNVYITYTPNEANHAGNWNYDGRYLRLVNTDDYYDISTFQVIAHSDSVLDLTYHSGNQSDSLQCTTDYSTLVDVRLNPTLETVAPDSDFYIDITYIPDTAEHNGVWDYDLSMVTLMSDSTSNRAHFKSKDQMDLDGTTITYRCSNNINASNLCKIGFPPLQGFKLTPSCNFVKVGDVFSIAVEYIPENAEHLGLNKWYYDTKFISQDFTRSSNELMVFKALGSTSNTGTAMIFNPVPNFVPAGIDMCYVNTKPVQSIDLLPNKKQFSAVGESFIVQVSYTPDDVPHDGDWHYDPTVFEMDTVNSSKNYGVFKLLQRANGDIISFISNTKTGTCYCTMASQGDNDEK